MAASMRNFRRFLGISDISSTAFRFGLPYPKKFCVRRFGQPAAQTHPHLLKQGEVTPGITKEEYNSRRTTLLNSAVRTFKGVDSVKDHIIIIPSATKTYMTHDIPYPFRQNTDFLYLCGFQEPDSVLILHTSPEGPKSVLFVPKRDPDRELWDGPRSGDKKAAELTGIPVAKNTDQLENYLADYCRQFSQYMIWYDYIKPKHPDFHNSIFSEFLNQDEKRALQRPVSLFHTQRLIKSPAEVELMRTSIEIASEAFVEVMKYSYPRVNESHLYAKMDFECRVRDAQFLAYPPVVAGGTRANIIHYINNNQLIHGGELVLMDAGCEYNGYTSDITRTWPVSGRFTDAQRALYMAVLWVQETCISMCTHRHSLADIYKEMLVLLGGQLVQLGIMKPMEDRLLFLQKVKEFCPHHVGHYLGMDVHDTFTVSRNTKLLPGMIVTSEPGNKDRHKTSDEFGTEAYWIRTLVVMATMLYGEIDGGMFSGGLYISENRLDVPEKFRGIGIRIEDDILVTDTEPVILSSSCPKHPDHIEDIMAKR